MKPFSIKVITNMFIIVKTMGRCITNYILVVIAYLTYLASENCSVMASASDRNWDPVCTERTDLNTEKFAGGPL